MGTATTVALGVGEKANWLVEVSSRSRLCMPSSAREFWGTTLKVYDKKKEGRGLQPFDLNSFFYFFHDDYLTEGVVYGPYNLF